MTKVSIQEKSYSFALKIISLYRAMITHSEFVLSKMSIASKEARETRYWLRLIRDSKLLEARDLAPLLAESEELVRIISSIVKTTAESK
jgi:hypothetical protein